MIKFEDGCVDCGLPCLGNSCPHHKEVHLFCDFCKTESDKLFKYFDDQYCADCLTEVVPLIKQEEFGEAAYCDLCGCEDEELYDFDDKVLCEDCLLRETLINDYEEESNE